MAYAPVVWQDNVTPLDQAHMNQMDQGIVGLDTGKVDKDSVVAAATRIVASKLLAGDAQPAFSLSGDGKLQWGAGGAAALDANLYRLSAGALKTDGVFASNQEIIARDSNATWRTSIGYVGGNAGINMGGDTSLYRAGVNQLQSPSNLRIGGYVDLDFANAGGQLRFGSAFDTSLYRSAAATLRTDGHMYVAGVLALDQQNGGNRLYFGSALDTALYRSAANNLKTDGRFDVAGEIYAQANAAVYAGLGAIGPAGQAALRFGADTNLYRSAANTLRADGGLTIAGPLWHYDDGATAAKGILLGSAKDTSLYRAAAGSLKTDGSFTVRQSLIVDTQDIQNKLYFGSALDTYLYRNGAGVLQTNGTLNVLAPGVSPNFSSLGLAFNGVGERVVTCGPPDSGGAGLRALVVGN